MQTSTSKMLTIEVPDEQSRRAYQTYVDSVLAESTIRGAIKSLYIYIDPNEPVFIICADYAVSGGPVKASEVVAIQELEKGARLTAESDAYMPKLLRALFNKYGKDNVSQPSRYEILIETPVKVDELSQMVIYDSKEELREGIIDTLTRMIPEGMRVRFSTTQDSKIIIVASEDPIKQSWLDKSKEIVRKAESLER